MLRVLLDIVLPPRCLACDGDGYPLCASCMQRFPWNDRACARCAAPGRAPLCRRCGTDPPPLVGARSVARYEGVARDALMRFKLGGERRAAAALAAPMAARAPEAAVFTPVPATKASVRARGFDPAALLARHVARTLGAACVDLLVKVRATRDSAGLGRAERRTNLEGAFAPARPAPPVVVLVDDIMTTGATAEACARALVAGGARAIHLLTFARTP